ncbi:hypothetical protein [Romboutsia ilealis]|uniref:hypothetical protein n=1 Tax=Romboutsia ilealis TaxID=1115758 RepID=UPI00272A50B9|nr:hypothetical protein [Romboutsia ilealis]
MIVNISNKEIGYDYNRICINFVPYDVNDNTKWRGNRSVSRLVPLLQDMVQIVNKYDPGMKETLLNVHYKIYYEGIYGIKTVSVKELLELDVKSNKRRYDFESFLLIPGYEHELNLRDISDEDIEVLKSITKSLGILMDEYYYKNEVARIVR